MKTGNLKIRLNQEVIDRLNTSAEYAMQLTAEAILSDIVSRGVVPFDVGTLEGSGFVSRLKDGVYAIVFSTPYARRWYFNLDEVKFQKSKNANAQDHWMDYYLDSEGKQWVIDTFMKFWKQESGGIIR